MGRRSIKATAALAAAVCAAALVTGCAPTPTPVVTPSPVATGFASDEDAFAAAEATYRAYSDALNARRADDQSTPEPDSFLTGPALDSSVQGAQRLREAGIRVEGSSTIVQMTRVAANRTSATIVACIDSSGSQVVDTHGSDVTPSDRPARSALEIEVVSASPSPLILHSDLVEEPACS